MSLLKRLFGGRTKEWAPAFGYGFAPDNPILCNGPAGERAYIAELRCPNDHALKGRRVGSFGGKCTDPAHHETIGPEDRPEDECLVDGYDLTCEGGEHSCFLYFDMYHAQASDRQPPEGLKRV